MKKATFGCEYIVKEEKILRPTVTVNRTGRGLANGERDLIVCGICGGVMSSKARYCMGCGAKFKPIKDSSCYKDFEITLSGQADGQMSINDLGEING